MEYRNPEIKEGINVTDTHPLKEFGFLTTVVITAVVVISAVLALSIDWLAEYVPFEYEQAMSQSVVKELDNRNAVDDYLQSLADAMAPGMDLPEGMEISVHYVNEEVVNAMATLGGHVMIYRGLMEQLPNENALVMLLGHEIAHVKLRHPIKGLGKGLVISLLFSALLGESSDVTAGLLGDASLMTLLSFNRDQEQDADEQGLAFTQAYYRHVNGFNDLYKVLQQTQQHNKLQPPIMLSSHPDTDQRIHHLTELANNNRWPVQGTLHPIPENILAHLKRDKDNSEKSAD